MRWQLRTILLVTACALSLLAAPGDAVAQGQLIEVSPPGGRRAARQRWTDGGPAAAVVGVAFAENDRCVLSADGAELKRWALDLGRRRGRLDGTLGTVQATTLSADGTTGLGPGGRLWNLESGEKVAEMVVGGHVQRSGGSGTRRIRGLPISCIEGDRSQARGSERTVWVTKEAPTRIFIGLLRGASTTCRRARSSARSPSPRTPPGGPRHTATECLPASTPSGRSSFRSSRPPRPSTRCR